MPALRISQLAERCGLPASTLRFYEDAGLLSADRTPAGYRMYGEEAIERLAFISSAKLLGLALEEIRTLLDVREDGVCASVRARLLPLVADRITDTESRIAELRAFSAHLAGVHADLSGPAPEGACGPECGCTTVGPTPPGPAPLTLSPTREDQQPRDVPVACTLGAAEVGERIAQWRELVGYAQRHEEIPDGVRLFFPASPDLAARVAALACAEQDCCAFFDFTLHLSTDALRLDVRTPATAKGMLADLLGVTA
ncbi:MAG: heavy metal-responsive transcriptional regulator [Actinobacteria bacterium]|nr:heavy metal-responsive transcriptional regulator [Actinomycetota bacterium]